MKGFAALALVLLAACGGGDDARVPEGEPADSSLAGEGGPLDSLAGGGADAPGTTVRATVDAAGPAAALGVIHDYYGALEGKDYSRAYSYWGGGGQASGQTLAEFTAGFTQTGTGSVRTGLPGRVDAGAGQRYLEIPAAVRATATSGEAQCFRGTYVLRMTEVDGATAEQRSWRIASADLRAARPELCDAGVALGETVADTVAALVGGFGGQLASVSLVAPADVVSRELRAQYAGYVTPALLEVWLERPAEAPGRRVSSPWPARVDVTEVRPVEDGSWEVAGDVVYLTAVEVTRGGAAAREPVTLRVVRDGGALRIASWQAR